jgi:DNA repair protein RecN (Recombination protein N)
VIEELRIRSLGVIDDAVLEFDPGLTVLTGETGAGKTMVVTGLGLLLGARADAGQIRRGAKQAVVEGTVRVAPDGPVVERIADAGGSVDDDVAVIARSVTAQGRSRAHVGGAGAPVAVLADIAIELAAVHGQSDQHQLLQPARQRGLLDAFAQADDERTQYRHLHTSFTEMRQRLAGLEEQRESRLQEADLLRFGLEEIAQTRPEIGEDVALLTEEQRLSHADELHGAAGSARQQLDSDNDADGAIVQLAEARRILDAVREHDEVLAKLADRVAELGYLTTDVAADLASYLDSVAVDPLRLSTVSDRRAALAHLTRKYGSTIDDVLQWSENATTRLTDLDSTDDELERLADELQTLRSELADIASRLSEHRQAAAAKLSSKVTKEMAALAMPHAVLSVAVEQLGADDGLQLPDGRCVRFGADGIDDVTIVLQPHADAPAQPLAKGASGGELSRVMLALEVVLAGVDPVPTFVFDEVDAGVGGKAAVEVGRRLARLARSAQVIVVTHLPQVAAFADRHLVVSKSHDGVVTSSDVMALDASNRPKELARMLAGLEDSALGQAHAEELLELAASEKRAT